MLKTIYAVTAAAIISAGIVALPSLSPQEGPISAGQGPRSDRHVKLSGSECPQKAWPYIKTSCLLDAQSPTASARVVRVIPADRTK
jgi:hypothetical protein